MIPEATPAPAPHSGVTHAFGICVEYICIRVARDGSRGEEGIASKVCEDVVGSLADAYCCCADAEVEDVRRERDMALQENNQ